MSSLSEHKKNVAITVVDSISKTPFQETIWGGVLIQYLYGNHSGFQASIAKVICALVTKSPFVSWLWGKYNDLAITKTKIASFCQEYKIDETEFDRTQDEYSCFNDFFIRKLRSQVRPIDTDSSTLIAPADARYTFIPHLDRAIPFTVKGTKFNLESFLASSEMASQFYGGSAVIARLCPSDCHRFYFPLHGKVRKKSAYIAGSLYSVSPIATSRFPSIWWNNKRSISYLHFDIDQPPIAIVEVGATNCGSIIQTFNETYAVSKGDEKGYFKLGGSAIVLLFAKNAVQLQPQLIDLQQKYQCEVYCKIGQKIGTMSGIK